MDLDGFQTVFVQGFGSSHCHDFVIILYVISVQFPDNAKPMSGRLRSRHQYFSTCCHAFVVFNLLSCFSRFQLAVTLHILSVQFPDNAKPMSRRMRSRCQYYSAKPLSKRVRSRRQDECEADVKTCAKKLVLKQSTGTHQICYSR